MIAKYALTFGYKIIEHFAAYYTREMGNERYYDMLSHTFELEPLKPRGIRETFFPCFDKIAENEHQEKIRILLGKEQRDKAAEEYSTFVQELPKKPFVNVARLLSEDAALKATMQNEDQALLGWWKAYLK